MSHGRRIIVFLVPPQHIVNGGILSIFSIAKESRQFFSIHRSKVLLATYPGTKSYGRNELFKNDEKILEFDDILKQPPPEFLQIHVPEYASHDVYTSLAKHRGFFEKIDDLRVNIMNQNILLMQPPADTASWFSLTPHVTQTIAHNKYATQQIADLYFLPTLHLSTFVDPGQYSRTSLGQKKDLILVSNDESAHKKKILDKVRKELPNYKIIIVDKMPYEQYKSLLSQAKFLITFGEGFDGYYVEGFFSGAITFAVYNNSFFPDKSFEKQENTYKDYPDMLRNIVTDMSSLADNEKKYASIVEANLKRISDLYSHKSYLENIKRFYQGRFSFAPDIESARALIGSIIKVHESRLKEINDSILERDTAIRDMEKMIADKSAAIESLNNSLDDILSSRSWKITKPLRKTSGLVKRQRKQQ